MSMKDVDGSSLHSPMFGWHEIRQCMSDERDLYIKCGISFSIDVKTFFTFFILVTFYVY